MDETLLCGEYFIWHYGESIRDFFVIWENLFWFGYHFFSIKLLTRTLVTPYKRFHQEYDLKNLKLEALGQDILLNLFMRLLGMTFRLAILAAGFVFELMVLAAGAAFLILWLLLPIVIPLLAFVGTALLFA